MSPPTGVRPEMRHFRAFVAVAEELNFTRAAERLFLAQQALSLHVRQLEDILGVRLFERTSRSVALTPAGTALLRHVPAALSRLDAGCRAAQDAAQQAAPLQVGFSSFLLFVGDIVQRTQAEAPDAQIIVRETWCEEAVAAVRSGSLDIAYVWSPPTDRALRTTVVRSIALGVFIAADHHLAARATVSTGDLAETPLLIMPREFFPRLHEIANALFPAHFEDGLVREYSRVTRGGFVDDPVARREALAGRAFLLADLPHVPPEGFVNVPLEPAVTVGAYMVHKPVPSRAGADAAPESLLEKMARLSLPAGGEPGATSRPRVPAGVGHPPA